MIYLGIRYNNLGSIIEKGLASPSEFCVALNNAFIHREESFELTNGWLERYSNYLAQRINNGFGM